MILIRLARLRRPPAAFILNGAITRPATGFITFRQPFPSYMQRFIKIDELVLEKNGNEIMTLCNFNKDDSDNQTMENLCLTIWKIPSSYFDTFHTRQDLAHIYISQFLIAEDFS